MNSKIVGMSLTTALWLGGSNLAYAQQAAPANDSQVVEDVIVTAQKTGAQAVQSTPLAITAFSARQIAEQQVTNVKDLVQYVPNLQVAQSSANAQIFIRGIGSTNVFAGSDPDVTVQVDGVYLARPSSQFGDFLDVERVEVLRGPQGTLYGRNAVGGTLNVISRAPSNSFSGKAAVTVGDYGLVQSQAYISGPLVADHLQGSLSVNYIGHKGYVDNIVPGAHDVDDANRGGLRGQLRAELGKVVATTRADWFSGREYLESYDQLLTPIRTPRPAPLANSTIGTYRKVALDWPQILVTQGGGVSEDIEIPLSDQLTFKSLTAYRENHYKVANDSDATELSSAFNRQTEDQHQVSQEFNLQWNSDRLAAVAGAYYLREVIDGTTRSSTPPTATERGALPHVVAEAKALFVQGSYKLTDALSLTLGGRYTWEDKDIKPYGYTRSTTTGALVGVPFTTPASSSYHAFTPKVGLDFKAADHVLLYASATKGFKSGGFNYTARTLAALRFAPETIWSYEAGAKTDWFDKRLRVNLTGFYYDYTGLQVQALLSPGNSFVGNSKDATVKGAELEITAKPISGLTLVSNFALLDAKYGTFPNASVPAGVVPYVTGDPRYSPATTFYNASGNSLNAAPKFSTLQAIQYEVPVSVGFVGLRAEYSYRSRTDYDPTNVDILSQPAYGLINLAIGFRTADGAWRAQALVKNATDKEYLMTLAAPGASPTGHAGPPRTLWLTLSREW